jgi:ABC-2 type transport system permease protein
MKTLHDIRLLCGRQLTHQLRNPVWLVVGFSTPILYLALFTPLLKHLAGAPGFPTGAVLDEFLPGILALVSFATGAGIGFNTIFELRSGELERFRVTPASRTAILLGPILASMAMMFVFDLVLIGAGAVFGFDVHPLGLLALAVLLGLLMVMMASFSIAMALLTKEISSFAAVINGINLPVLLLAGVLLPISLGPLWMRVIAHFNPLYYLVEGARTLATGSFSGPHVWQAFAVLAPMCALVVAWATRVFRTAVS